MTTIAVQAIGLTKRFGSHVVLRGVDLQIAAGECVALTGPNGTGKTTLLGCLAMALRPDAGKVFWFSQPAAARSALRRLIGAATHQPALYGALTLRENLLFAARIYGVPEPRQQADRWLEEAGLAPYALRRPDQVSRGMNQRLALARAMIHDPPILLLDEPFASLDDAGCRWLLASLAQRRDRGAAICFVAHGEQRLVGLADRVCELRSGRLIATAVPGEARLDTTSPAARAA